MRTDLRSAVGVGSATLGCRIQHRAEVVEAERGGVEVVEAEVVGENSNRERPPQTWRRHKLRCYMSAALCYIAVMLETQSMHAVVSNLVKQYRYCSLVLPVHVQ